MLIPIGAYRVKKPEFCFLLSFLFQTTEIVYITAMGFLILASI